MIEGKFGDRTNNEDALSYEFLAPNFYLGHPITRTPRSIGFNKKLNFDLGRPITRTAQILESHCSALLPIGRSWPPLLQPAPPSDSSSSADDVGNANNTRNLHCLMSNGVGVSRGWAARRWLDQPQGREASVGGEGGEHPRAREGGASVGGGGGCPWSGEGRSVRSRGGTRR